MTKLKPPPRPRMVALYGALAAAAITLFQVTVFSETYPYLSEEGARRAGHILGLFLGWCMVLSGSVYLAARTLAKCLVIYERHLREKEDGSAK